MSAVLIRWRLPLVLCVLLVWLTFADMGFWTTRNLRNLVVPFSIDGIMVVGMAVVMIAGGFDLSIGAVLALSGVAFMGMQDGGVALAVGTALLCAGCSGLANGLLIRIGRVNPFIATLGMMLVVRGLAMTYTNAFPIAGRDLALMSLARGSILGIPTPAVAFLCAAVTGQAFMALHRTGRAVYAIGGNSSAARASGVPTNRVTILCYVACSVCAGVAGVLLASRLNTGSPIIGEATALSVITAVLLGGVSLSGGVGSVFGACAGWLCISLLQNGLSLAEVPAYYQRIAQGGLLLAMVIIDRWPQRAYIE